MAGVLHYLVRVGSPSALRFLRVAVERERIEPEHLVSKGVPLYDIRDFVRRLSASGEVDEHSAWNTRARESYRKLLENTPEPAVPVLIKGSVRSITPATSQQPLNGLGDAELLAVIANGGNSPSAASHKELSKWLHKAEGLLGLAAQGADDLQRAGMDAHQAASIAAAFELGRRVSRAARRERRVLRTPEEVAAAVAPEMGGLAHEELWCLPLDAKSRLIGEPRVVSRGDIDGTDAGPRAFFRLAVQAGAATAIAVHNHPSGDPSPSKSDCSATVRLVAAGRIMDVALVDHLVIGDGGRFISLRRHSPECFT